MTVVAGLGGNTRADAATVRLVEQLGLTPPVTPVEAPHGTRVLSVSDPDDEVRTAVRLVLDAARAGVPLDRMAILFGATEPYARLVHEQLTAAGIPHNGAAVRTPRGERPRTGAAHAARAR